MRGTIDGTGTEEGRLVIQFHMQPVKDEAKSLEEGRPIFVEQEFVRIMVPGDKDNIIDRPVWDNDKQRFGLLYEKWKSGVSDATEGTPLSAWPGVSRAQVEELAFFGCKTVENLANMSDSNAQKFMGIQLLRQKARDFLAAAAGNAPAEKMRAELSQRDNEIETLKRQLKEQGDAIAELRKSKR